MERELSILVLEEMLNEKSFHSSVLTSIVRAQYGSTIEWNKSRVFKVLSQVHCMEWKKLPDGFKESIRELGMSIIDRTDIRELSM